MTDEREKNSKENKRLTLKLLGFALGSFAFGFALVPLYDVLCDITGFGNQRSLAEARLTVESPVDHEIEDTGGSARRSAVAEPHGRGP